MGGLGAAVLVLAGYKVAIHRHMGREHVTKGGVRPSNLPLAARSSVSGCFGVIEMPN